MYICVCIGITGERQAQIFREKYIKSVLSQEIGWFDSVGANELSTKLSDMAGQLRDGLTYKTADVIQFTSQVVGAIIVGLALDPYVALIMFACKFQLYILTLLLTSHILSCMYINRHPADRRYRCHVDQFDSICY